MEILSTIGIWKIIMGQNSNFKYKFIKYIVYTIISLFILLNLLLYGTYRYNISQIDTTKITQHKSYNYKNDVYATYWATFAYSSDIEIKPFYTFDFPFALYTELTAKSMNDRYNNSSLTLTHWLSSNTLSNSNGKEIKGNKHLLRTIYSIWMTHNLTAKEAMDIIFSKFFYANGYFSLEEASEGYFHKEVDELSVYELLMLHAIDHAPSRFNPRKHKERLLKRVNMLIKKAKMVFPKRYGELEELSVLPEFF